MTDIYVRDKETGTVHRVGDDPHDCLWVHNGTVIYYNLKNGEGTRTGVSYEFVESDIYGEISDGDMEKAEAYRESIEDFRRIQKELAAQGFVLIS